MFFLLKFTISFVVSFLILSIPIGEVTVFHGLTRVTAPYTQKVFSMITKNSKEAAEVTKEASKKFFDNTRPSFSDQVGEQVSGVSKKIQESIQEDLAEEYTIEEKQLLEQVLKKGRSY